MRRSLARDAYASACWFPCDRTKAPPPTTQAQMRYQKLCQPRPAAILVEAPALRISVICVVTTL
jgi:hypothetical protein